MARNPPKRKPPQAARTPTRPTSIAVLALVLSLTVILASFAVLSWRGHQAALERAQELQAKVESEERSPTPEKRNADSGRPDSKQVAEVALAPPVLPARDSGAGVPPPRRSARKRSDTTASRPPRLPKSVLPTASKVLSFTESPVWAGATVERARFLWGNIPSTLQQQAIQADPPVSNLRPDDYAGAEACKDCHPNNYRDWATHPHRWMNAKADETTVQGDFSGDASISYRGGDANFYQQDGQYRMRLTRDDITRTYSVNRTIGSRFQQYYVGKLLQGPEPTKHPVRQIDHVLPFGYWLSQREWVPVVHVDLELPDAQRHDPFLHPANRPYDRSCASCHTTQPAGDRLLRAVGRERLSAFTPHNVLFSALGYLQENRNEVLQYADFYANSATDRVKKALSVMDDLAAESYAAALGITCEGCHNGARFHAEREAILPRFFPSGEHLAVFADDDHEEGEQQKSKGKAILAQDVAWGRNRANLNWTCAQCHTGGRSMFACGASTWNSTEYSDAMRGACYDPEMAAEKSMHSLTCVHCHDPHKPTGERWSHSPTSDDDRCLACHDKLASAEARLAHTHHPPSSSGDRCMNCHMPKINEGMEDVVRTHLIFSPTDTAMLEANHPNACNLCHLKENIDWTLKHLSDWYGLRPQSRSEGTDPWKVYDESKIQRNYPQREGSVGIGWLQSDNEATRLVAVEALARSHARWALPEMLKILDDDYLLNRQFAMQRLEEMLELDMEQEFGYRHYQYASERAEPLRRIQAKLVPAE